METKELIPGPFDRFIHDRNVDQEISSGTAFQGITRGVANDLTYDASSFSSLLNYLNRVLSEQMAGLEKQQFCAYCGRRYQEKDNIGRLECDYHPSPKTNGGGCCNDPFSPNGCRKADHRPYRRIHGAMWTAAEHTVKIPVALQTAYNIPDEQIVRTVVNQKEDARSYLVVSRIELTPRQVN